MADEERWIDIEIIGVKETIAALLSSGPRRREFLKDLLKDVADNATAAERIYAPTGETSYIVRHIYQTGIMWRPGGAGGGGKYQIITGVRRGTSDHPIYVHFGTKNAPFNNLRGSLVGGTGDIQGRIYPRGDRGFATTIATRRLRARGDDVLAGRRPVLTFQKRGEPRKFRAWVRGQKSQPFVYWAFRNAAIYAQGRIRTGALDKVF